MHRYFKYFFLMLALTISSPVLAAKSYKGCAENIRNQFKKPLSKKSKIKILRRIKDECIRGGRSVSKLYINCKLLRLMQLKRIGAAKVKAGLKKCSLLDNMLEKIPRDRNGEICKTKPCMKGKGKSNDICAVNSTVHGKIGAKYCRDWMVLKACATQVNLIGASVFPDFIMWQSGKKQDALSCDDI